GVERRIEFDVPAHRVTSRAVEYGKSAAFGDIAPGHITLGIDAERHPHHALFACSAGGRGIGGGHVHLLRCRPGNGSTRPAFAHYIKAPSRSFRETADVGRNLPTNAVAIGASGRLAPRIAPGAETSAFHQQPARRAVEVAMTAGRR